MKFVETDYERQSRVLQELEHLQKGCLTALEFEPIWEKALAELGKVEFGRLDRGTLLTYLEKLPPVLRRSVLGTGARQHTRAVHAGERERDASNVWRGPLP